MTDHSSTITRNDATSSAAATTSAVPPGGGVAMINPHNPEFITKRPWYLGNDAPAAAAASAAVGLDHQAADVRLEKLPRSLATAEAILEQERRQQQELASSQTVEVGMWLEALKRNKPPYRMGQVKRVGQKANNANVVVVDIQFEDGTLERSIPLSRLRWTKAGSRAVKVDASLYGKETYDAKRDMYHGYDKDIHNLHLERKFATRDELRQKLRQQQQQENEEATKNNKNDDDINKDQAEEGTSTNNNNKTTTATTKKKEHAASDSDSDSDVEDHNNDDDDDSEDEFVQRDEDAMVHTSRLARQGGVGGAQMKVTARNLRIREDTAKYLRNLNPNSAYYDPKSRSMRDNPNPHLGNEAPYVGDNFVRISGDAIKLAETQLFAWDASATSDIAATGVVGEDDGGASAAAGGAAAELHPQANPTQAELLQRQFKTKSANVKLEQKKAVLAKYGGGEYLDGSDGLAKAINIAKDSSSGGKTTTAAATSAEDKSSSLLAAAQERKIRFGVSTATEEYTRDGRKKGDLDHHQQQQRNIQRVAIPSKYEEDIFSNGHWTVWGSYFHVGAFKWGYADDHSLLKNSYCTGENGRLANDEANEMQFGTGVAGSAALAQARGMMLSQQQKAGAMGQQQQQQQRPLTTSSRMYGEADAKAVANLDPNKLQQAITKEELRKQQQQEQRDDRKRKYNSVDTQVDVTEEEMEAYRLRKERSSDPMAKLNGSDEILDYQ